MCFTEKMPQSVYYLKKSFHYSERNAFVLCVNFSFFVLVVQQKYEA